MRTRRIAVGAIVGALTVASGGTVRAGDPCDTTDFDPAPHQSNCADLAISPRVVRPGGTMTVTTNVGCNGAYVFCSSAIAAVKLDSGDATAVSMAAPMYYGTSIPSVIAGRGVQVGPGHHVVVFTIDRKAKDACVTGVSTDPSFYGIFPGYRGPFVSVGVGSSWSTPDGFKIDHAGKRDVELRIAAATPAAGHVWPGETIDYSLHAVPSTDADSLTITADVPAGTQYVDASADQNGSFDGSSVKWTFDADNSTDPVTLVPPKTVHFSARVLDPDTIKSLHAITLDGRAEAVIGADTVDTTATRDLPYAKVATHFDPFQTANFGALSIESGTVVADGYRESKVTVGLAESTGGLITSGSVELRPNVLVDPVNTSDPRLIVTDETGLRLWPGRLGGGSLDFHAKPTLTVDNTGHAMFRVLIGSQAGTSLLFEADEANHASVVGSETENLTGTQASLPAAGDLAAALNKQLTDDNAAFAPSGAGSAAQKQDTLLAWMGLVRWTAISDPKFAPSLAVEFAPIHTAGGHAGIVFYARGSSPNALLSHLSSGGPVTAYVLDVDAFNGAGDSLGVSALPAIGAWESAVGGPAVAGRLTPDPDDDLEYFGWPYPSPAGLDATSASWNLHANTVHHPKISALVHSPVNLLFTDGQSKSLGIDASGAMKLDLPGVIVRGDHGNPAGYVLPGGNYSITLTGTKSGAATVAIATSGDSGVANTVFSLASAKSATGSVAVDATTGPAQQMTFHGTSYAAKPGLTFVVKGAPKKPFRIGRKPVKVSVVVKDPWKRPVAGALVTVDFPGFSGSPSYLTQAFTDAKGKASFFPALPNSNYSGTLTVSAPGYVDAVSTVGAF